MKIFVAIILLISTISVKPSTGLTYSEDLKSGKVVEWNVKYLRIDGVKINEPYNPYFNITEGSVMRIEILKDIGSTEINTVEEFNNAFELTVDNTVINITESYRNLLKTYFIIPNMDGSTNRFIDAVSTYNPILIGATFNPYLGIEGDYYIEKLAIKDTLGFLDFEYTYEIDTGIVEVFKQKLDDDWLIFERVEVDNSNNDEGIFSDLDMNVSWILLSLPIIAIVRKSRY